tara:strand:+ start:292 stop:447 length:156 start_codon:yes stop_codon:yes gene_type:complete
MLPIAFILFQFQYGAIKSTISLTIAKALLLFQFQYGAIKRCNDRTAASGYV